MYTSLSKQSFGTAMYKIRSKVQWTNTNYSHRLWSPTQSCHFTRAVVLLICFNLILYTYTISGTYSINLPSVTYRIDYDSYEACRLHSYTYPNSQIQVNLSTTQISLTSRVTKEVKDTFISKTPTKTQPPTHNNNGISSPLWL